MKIVRTILKLAAVLCLLGISAFAATGGACPSSAPAGKTCFYASWALGVDSNDGLTKLTPIKHAPYMTGCTSGMTCYTLQSTFNSTNGLILRGGDVWPAAALPWEWNNCTSATYPGCYMGYDPAWNNGTLVSVTPTTPGHNCSVINVALSVGGATTQGTATANFYTSGPWAGNLQHITINTVGSGYTSNPSVSFAGSTCDKLPTAVADITRPVIDGSATQWTPANVASSCCMTRFYGWNNALFDGLEMRGLTVSNTVPLGASNLAVMATPNSNGIVFNSVYFHNFGVTNFPETGSTIPTNAVSGLDTNWGYAATSTVQNSFFENYEMQQGLAQNPSMNGGTCGWSDGTHNLGSGTGWPGCNQSTLVHGVSTFINNVDHDGRGLFYDDGLTGEVISGNYFWNTMFDAGSQHGDGPYIMGSMFFFNNYLKNLNGGTNYLFEDCLGTNCSTPNTSWIFNNVMWDYPDPGNTQNFMAAAGESANSSTTWSTNPSMHYLNNTCYGSNSGGGGCIGAGQMFGAPAAIWAQLQFDLRNNHIISTQTNAHWYLDGSSTGGNNTCPYSTGAPNNGQGCGTWNGLSYPNISATQAAIDAVQVIQTPSAAAAQGYTLANWLAPTASSNATVTASGANLTSLCSGVLTALCKDINGNSRPASGPWQEGAYQFGGTIRQVGSGQTYTTIQACATAAVAGDICNIHAGTYTETVTPAGSGSPGNPITFKANSGDTVNVVGGFSIGSLSYITIGGPSTSEGLHITSLGVTGGAFQNVTIQNNSISNTTGRCVQAGSGNTQMNNIYILNNTFNLCGTTQGALSAAVGYLECSHCLIDGNTVQHSAEGFQLYGPYSVVRNNHFGPITAADEGANHADGVESSCSGDLPLQHMLYENNVSQSWRSANAHGLLMRDTNSCGMTANILRFSVFQDMGSGWAVTSDQATSGHVYNNTMSNDNEDAAGGTREDLVLVTNATGWKFKNNLMMNAQTNTTPFLAYVDASSASGFAEDHNLAYFTGFSGTWDGWGASDVGNYAASDVFNQDPKLVNQLTDAHLQAGSPAIGAGGSLTTTVGAGATSTSLTVADAGYFSDGYGIPNVAADWLRIGSSTYVQIASINYATNVITLASAVSWNNGDPVYLYKDSNGNVVLKRSSPDMGAYQSSPDNYFDQASAGLNDGSSCANARTYASMTAGDWAPGNTVHICGTGVTPLNTTAISAKANGTSGNPVTLKFEPGAILQSPYFPAAGVIVLDGHSYITVDGGTNGIVKATANGTARTYQTDSTTGISINSTDNITIKNLAINDIYVRVANTSGSTGFNSSAVLGVNATNFLADTLSVTNVKTGVGVNFNTVGGSNYEVRNSYFLGVEVPTIQATSTTNATFTNVLVHDNNFAGGADAWDDPVGNSFHHDGGGHYWAQATGAHIYNLRFYNNWVHGIWGNDSAYYGSSGGTHITARVYPEETGGDVWIYNNVFDITSGNILYQSAMNGEVFCKAASSPGMYCHVVNNLFIGPAGNSTQDTALETDGTASVSTWENNIVMNFGMAYYLAAQAHSTTAADYNVYYNIGSSGWNFDSYANWRAAGQDAHSSTVTNVSPNLDANYKPQAGSKAIGAGLNLTSQGILTLDADKSGSVRPSSGAWDAGVYQYSPVHYYYAQTAAGLGDGSLCANAWAIGDGTNGINTAAKWVPGNNLHLCGTITGVPNTTLITAAGNGSSGSPITILFEPGSVLTNTYWPSSLGGTAAGAITLGTGRSWIVVDGQNQGTVQNTANGSSLANHVASTGVSGFACSNCTVRNLTVSNLYVQVLGSGLLGDSSLVRGIDFTGQHWVVSGNTLHDCGWCITNFYSNNDTDTQIFQNNIYNMGHGVAYAAGATGAVSTAPALQLHDNHIHDTANWAATGCPYHDDGLHTYGNSTSSMDGVYVINNLFDGDWGTCPTGYIFVEAAGSGTPSHMKNSYWANNVGIVNSNAVENTNGWFMVASGDSGAQVVVNNTMIGSGASDNALCFSMGNLSGLTFKNNTASSCQSPLNIASSTIVALDYNLYGTTTCTHLGNCFAFNGSFTGSFSAWKTATGGETHSVSNLTPLLNADGSPQAGSPVIGAGANLSSLATGYLVALQSDTTKGMARAASVRPSSGAWDVGAYQYTGGAPAHAKEGYVWP